MMTRPYSTAAALLALSLTACSASGSDRRLRVGNEPDGPGGGAGVASWGAQDGGVGSGEHTLGVRVQDVDDMVIDIVTLSCAGECADVEAVARGGNPPYRFAWEDGSTHPRRQVCLDASASLSVSVHDTAIEDPEFRYDAQTATASVSVRVLECPDSHDGGASAELCVSNPSFEGTPARNLLGPTFDASAWQVCSMSPDIIDATIDAAYPSATEGHTYLGLLGDSPALTEAVGQALCSPMQAGARAFLLVDTAGDANERSRFQLYGSQAACGEDQLLAEIDPGAPVAYATWTTHCIAITPAADIAFIKVKAIGDSGGYLLMDNLRPANTCP